MTGDFADQVASTLERSPNDLGFKIITDRASDAFGDALAVAQSGDVRIRVVRDRGQVFVDIGSAAEPDVWFDSAVVMDALGLSKSGGFGSRDVESVVTGLLGFLKSVWPELTAMFDVRHFAATKRRLSQLQEERAAKRWG